VLFGTFWVKKDVYITVTEWRAVGTEGEWNFLLQSQVEEQRSNVDCRLENWQRFCEMWSTWYVAYFFHIHYFQ